MPQRFSRSVTVYQDRVQVEDRLENIEYIDNLVQAPKHSLRHVASAKSFMPDDLYGPTQLDAFVQKSNGKSFSRSRNIRRFVDKERTI